MRPAEWPWPAGDRAYATFGLATPRRVVRAGDPDRLHRADGRVRGGLPRAAGMVPVQERAMPAAPDAEILLPLHLRVLLQPLGDAGGPARHRLPADVCRLERVRDRVLLARVRRERLPEPLLPPAGGHHQREEADRGDRARDRGEAPGDRDVGPKGPRARRRVGRAPRRAGGERARWGEWTMRWR